MVLAETSTFGIFRGRNVRGRNVRAETSVAEMSYIQICHISLDDLRLYAASKASIPGETVEVHYNGDNKIFIWGGISSHIRSECTFYGSARAWP